MINNVYLFQPSMTPLHPYRTRRTAKRNRSMRLATRLMTSYWWLTLVTVEWGWVGAPRSTTDTSGAPRTCSSWQTRAARDASRAKSQSQTHCSPSRNHAQKTSNPTSKSAITALQVCRAPDQCIIVLHTWPSGLFFYWIIYFLWQIVQRLLFSFNCIVYYIYMYYYYYSRSNMISVHSFSEPFYGDHWVLFIIISNNVFRQNNRFDILFNAAHEFQCYNNKQHVEAIKTNCNASMQIILSRLSMIIICVLCWTGTGSGKPGSQLSISGQSGPLGSRTSTSSRDFRVSVQTAAAADEDRRLPV